MRTNLLGLQKRMQHKGDSILGYRLTPLLSFLIVLYSTALGPLPTWPSFPIVQHPSVHISLLFFFFWPLLFLCDLTIICLFLCTCF